MAKTLASLETSSNRLTIQSTDPLVLFIVTLEVWMGNLKKIQRQRSPGLRCAVEELCF